MIRKFKEEDTVKVMTIWTKGNFQAHSFIDKDYWLLNFNKVKDEYLKPEYYLTGSLYHYIVSRVLIQLSGQLGSSQKWLPVCLCCLCYLYGVRQLLADSLCETDTAGPSGKDGRSLLQKFSEEMAGKL